MSDVNLPTPITRKEMYLSAILGASSEVPEKPITREEQYLVAILEGGGTGGTTDYAALKNKPSINGVTLSGSLELADLMENVTQESVDEAVSDAEIEKAVADAGIEEAVADAWNAVFDGEAG